jgi:alpha-tubulin suppressor-like RCC1 family protein
MFRIARPALLLLGVLAPMLIGGQDPAAGAPRPEAGRESAVRNASKVAVGDTVACALTNGRAFCWGDESEAIGQVGDGPGQAPYGVPRQVIDIDGSGPLPRVTDVAAGDGFACAIAYSSRTVYCWGNNDVGQLGNGGSTPSHIPVAVQRSANRNLRGAFQIDAFGSTACAVIHETLTIGPVSRAYCWGEGSDGQLGSGSPGDRARASSWVLWDDPSGPLQPLDGVTQVTVGGTHACARQTGGRAYCWGQDHTSTFSHAYATRVYFDGRALCCTTTIDAGGTSTCAVTNANNGRRAYCWGSNDVGQLGDGTNDPADEAVLVQAPSGDSDLLNVHTLAVGRSGACAALRGGGTFCWGGGLLSDNGATPWPRAVRNPTDTGVLQFVSQMALDRTACAVLNNGQLRCWGPGEGGTLGNATSDFTPHPVVVRRP